MTYASSLERQSTTMPDVEYLLRRPSFGRRLQLARLLREHLEAIAKLSLDVESASREAETALLAAEMDAIHLHWGLESIEGLEIDGEPATVDSLIEAGPEELVKEILDAVRHETGLTAEERKNSAPHSTSCAAEGQGRAMRGSAANASRTDSTKNETAGASSPLSTNLAAAGSCGDGSNAVLTPATQ